MGLCGGGRAHAAGSQRPPIGHLLQPDPQCVWLGPVDDGVAWAPWTGFGQTRALGFTLAGAVDGLVDHGGLGPGLLGGEPPALGPGPDGGGHGLVGLGGARHRLAQCAAPGHGPHARCGGRGHGHDRCDRPGAGLPAGVPARLDRWPGDRPTQLARACRGQPAPAQPPEHLADLVCVWRKAWRP